MSRRVRRYLTVVLMAGTMSSTLIWWSRCLAQEDQGEIKRTVVNKVTPLYPDLLRKMHLSGSVKIEVVVAPDGSPKSQKILGGHPLLAQVATDALRKWKWAPNPRETTELIEIKFNLN